MSAVRVTFWGVRGSIASPGLSTAKYGGNTLCVEIKGAGGAHIICDAGTGMRELGLSLVKGKDRRPITAHILLSHLHLDHYIGLPFFKPLYNRDNKFTILGPDTEDGSFADALVKALRPPYFPVNVVGSQARITIKGVSEKEFKIGAVKVIPMDMNHPGGSFGWRFYFPDNRSIVYVTDNEPLPVGRDAELIKWMSGADILMHDAQYSPEKYKKRHGWGHSPYTYPLDIASRAKIKRVVLFHFDPEDRDSHLDSVLKKARHFVKKQGCKVRCDLAREGVSIAL